MSLAPNRFLVLATLAALAAAAPALAANSSSAVQARTQYLQDRAACLSGKSAEDQKTCLREAGAAEAEAKRNRLADAPQADYERNRLARCDVHKDAAEREYCERRMRGEGRIVGSVADGGILRELTVTVPASEAPAGKPQ